MSILIVLHLMVVIALVICILLQQTSTSGAIGSSSSSVATSKNVDMPVTNITKWLIAAFFSLSLLIAVQSKQETSSSGGSDTFGEPALPSLPETNLPEIPEVPSEQNNLPGIPETNLLEVSPPEN